MFFFPIIFVLFFKAPLYAYVSYNEIGKEHLPALPENHKNSIAHSTTGKNFSTILKETLHEHEYLEPAIMRQILFRLFNESEITLPSTPKLHQVLDATSRQDLHLICGPKSNPTFCVANKINRTHTQAGYVTLLKQLSTPTYDLQILRNRQEIIKTILDSPHLFKKIAYHLTELKKHENTFLSFWSDDLFFDLLKQEELALPKCPQLSEWINKNSTLVEINSYTRLVNLVARHLQFFLSATVLPVLGVVTLLEYSKAEQKLSKMSDMTGITSLKTLSAPGLFLYLLHYRYNSRLTESAANIVGGPASATDVFYFKDALNNIITLKKCLHSKLIHVSYYFYHITMLRKVIAEYPELKKHFNFNLLTALPTCKLKDFKKLCSLLETSTFDTQTPTFFSSYGRLNVAYILMHELKNFLVPWLAEVGKIDTFLASASLIKESQTSATPYCFAHFITDSTKPSLTAKHFWNPTLNPQKAVANSLTLGAHNPPHVIVSGANAGGKSTTMRGLALAIVCAQSLGIAPAFSLTFTPYHHVITYLNITDDIAAQRSHFRAGAARAKELLTTAQKTTAGLPALIAVDEVFDGTTFKEGQAAAYSFIESLGTFPYVTCITITHFPKIPELEKNGRFKNYKVSVSFNTDGTLSRSYLLEPGISDQKIALHILKEEGFDTTFLNATHDHILEKETHA